MTDTPHLEALAMRTRAADEVLSVELGFYDGIGGDWHPHDRKDLMQHAASAILALPLEADPAALVAEALRLPEVRAVIRTATIVTTWDGCWPGNIALERCVDDLKAAIAALVQP